MTTDGEGLPLYLVDIDGQSRIRAQSLIRRLAHPHDCLVCCAAGDASTWLANSTSSFTVLDAANSTTAKAARKQGRIRYIAGVKTGGAKRPPGSRRLGENTAADVRLRRE